MAFKHFFKRHYGTRKFSFTVQGKCPKFKLRYEIKQGTKFRNIKDEDFHCRVGTHYVLNNEAVCMGIQKN